MCGSTRLGETSGGHLQSYRGRMGAGERWQCLLCRQLFERMGAAQREVVRRLPNGLSCLWHCRRDAKRRGSYGEVDLGWTSVR